jgi:hypothetical protein
MTEPGIDAFVAGGETLRWAIESLSREPLLWRRPETPGATQRVTEP